MQCFTDECPCDGQLHRLNGLDSAGLFVISDDFQTVHQRHTFTLPHLWLHGFRVGRALVLAHKAESGAGAIHNEPGGTVSHKGNPSCFSKADLDRGCDAISAWREENNATPGHASLDGCRVVLDPVTHGTERFHAVSFGRSACAGSGRFQDSAQQGR